MRRRTCDKCEYYTAYEYANRYPENNNNGACELAGDSNDDPNPPDRISGWDYEGFRAGVYVGPKFGCIHWIKKGVKIDPNKVLT